MTDRRKSRWRTNSVATLPVSRSMSFQREKHP